MAKQVSSKKVSQWMADALRANPNTRPEWLIKQVAISCKSSERECLSAYQEVRDKVAEYRAAPITKNYTVRLQMEPPTSSSPEPAEGQPLVVKEVTVVGDPNNAFQHIQPFLTPTPAAPTNNELPKNPFKIELMPLETPTSAPNASLPPLSTDLNF